jgi:hypothetical protein
LQDIEDKLKTWYKMANWLQATLIVLGVLAIGCSLFITAFAGSDFLGSDIYSNQDIGICDNIVFNFNNLVQFINESK